MYTYFVAALAYNADQESSLNDFELDNLRNYWPKLSYMDAEKRVKDLTNRGEYVLIENEQTKAKCKVSSMRDFEYLVYTGKLN